MPLVDSLSPRRRSGERVSERGFQLVGPIRWNLPLSPALSPLVPRRERERGPSTIVVAEMRPNKPGPPLQPPPARRYILDFALPANIHWLRRSFALDFRAFLLN